MLPKQYFKRKEVKIRLSDHFNYKHLLRFVMPSIVMMVFTSIYGVVDGLFVSNYVGDTAFAAINLIMPLNTILGGVGFMLGSGGSALVAKILGEQRKEQADRYFTMMIWVSVIAGIILTVFGLIIMRPVSLLLGATEGMLSYCVLYGSVTLGFTVPFMLQYAFQSFLIAAEKPNLGLLATVAAGVTNMVLDALFIVVFKWGVVGAALATGMSQCVGAVIPLIYFLRPNTSLLKLVRTRLEIKPVLKACANGSSEMVSNATSAIIGILYNFQLLKYAGQDGVSSYGVLMYVQFVFAAIFIGYSMGSAPIISYHYGSENYAELKSLLKKSNFLMFITGAAMVAAAQLLAVPLAKLFVGYKPALFEMTVRALRISTLSFIIVGFNIFASSFFTALNDGGVSAAISFFRTFIFKMAAILILPIWFNLDGIWFADVTAEIFAFVISIIFLLAKRKKYQYM